MCPNLLVHQSLDALTVNIDRDRICSPHVLSLGLVHEIHALVLELFAAHFNNNDSPIVVVDAVWAQPAQPFLRACVCVRDL